MTIDGERPEGAGTTGESAAGNDAAAQPGGEPATEPQAAQPTSASEPNAADESATRQAAAETGDAPVPEAAPALPAAATRPQGTARNWRTVGIGAALVLVPGALVAYLLGRPMTILNELGFPTMIPGQTGYSLHPSAALFYVGILCLLAVAAGAGTIAAGLFPARRPELPSLEPGFVAWLRRHAWSVTLFVLACAVLFPTLGQAGLWDPWETHYGLVALRMVEQDDWISTLDMGWNEWFFSKPILLFWLMGFGLVGLGQDAAADGNPPLIEWSFRIPIVLLALATIMTVYLLASRRWGKRAGFFAGLALLTMPQFFLIARQAMTDMPFVAPLTIGLCFLALALGERDDRPAVGVSLFRGRLRVSSYHVLLAAITMVALPQALTVLTHNKARTLAVFKANAPAYETARVDRDPMITDDVLLWGSLGQAEDGNDHCVDLDCSRQPGRPDAAQVNDKLRPEVKIAYPLPAPLRGRTHLAWGLVFLGLWAGALAMVSRRTSRTVDGPTQRDVYLYAFYLAAAVATLAKGLLGFAIPGLIILLYLAVSGEWRELKRLRIVRGLVVFLAAAGPWYTMMIVRHGNQWFQQFIVHDHFKRSTSGVHGDRGALGYFVQQLGIGTFPWAALLPAALFALLWLRWERQEPNRPSEGERVALFATLWGLAMFAFFTANSTKFHHYVFPALPGFALCLGLLVDRMLDSRHRWVPIVTLGSLAFFAFVARDLTTTLGTRIRGYERLIQLYMYKYDRIWPDPKVFGEFLDYSTEMMVFAAVFGALLVLLLVPSVRSDSPWRARLAQSRLPAWVRGMLEHPRRIVMALFCAAAVSWAGFGLHIYFNQISPHWSEGYLVKLYYELRRGPDERLIAYSLNWHGENCYTANRAKILMTEHGFDRDWTDFPEWLKRHQGREYYFILGKGGGEGLKTKLNSAIPGAGKTVEVVSGNLSNKYDLARARLCAPENCPPEPSPRKPSPWALPPKPPSTVPAEPTRESLAP